MLIVDAFAPQQLKGTREVFLPRKELTNKESGKPLLHFYIRGKGIARKSQTQLRSLRVIKYTSYNYRNGTMFPLQTVMFGFSRQTPVLANSEVERSYFIMFMIVFLATLVNVSQGF